MIFISYRRGEDAAAAGRLYDRLEHIFGHEQVFLDVDSIPPGKSFTTFLRQHVAACEVMLVVIGRGWLTATDETGQRRLDNPDDFVRIEIASGLAQGKRVIPVLVGHDVTMPGPKDLPKELMPLIHRQAVRIAQDQFRDDAERLARVLKKALAEVEANKAEERRQSAEVPGEQDRKERKGAQLKPPPPQAGPKRLAEEEEERKYSPIAAQSSRKTPVLISAAAALLLLVSGAAYLAWDIFGGAGRQPSVATRSAPRASGQSPSETLDPERPAAVASGASSRSEMPPRPTAPPDNADRDRGASESSEEEGAGSPPGVSTTIIAPELQEAMTKPAPSPLPTAPLRRVTKGGVFQDCSICPPMIEVPVGSFQMGNRGEDSTEQPVHEVALKNRFAIGIREVTYGEWMACVKDQGCKHAPELASTTDQSPMRDVSWADAVQYAAWLKKTTQQPYRLPTEAEWEYAARANSLTRYWWGNDAGLVYANCRGCGGEWNRDAPLKVASYPPNPFGIFDMNGSVSEWVSDCWHSNYKGAPNDGRSWETPGCQQRVLRGGSWRDDPKLVSSFSRFYYDDNIRYIANGFRVALTLD